VIVPKLGLGTHPRNFIATLDHGNYRHYPKQPRIVTLNSDPVAQSGSVWLRSRRQLLSSEAGKGNSWCQF